MPHETFATFLLFWSIDVFPSTPNPELHFTNNNCQKVIYSEKRGLLQKKDKITMRSFNLVLDNNNLVLFFLIILVPFICLNMNFQNLNL